MIKLQVKCMRYLSIATLQQICKKEHGTLYKNGCFIPTIIMHFNKVLKTWP